MKNIKLKIIITSLLISLLSAGLAAWAVSADTQTSASGASSGLPFVTTENFSSFQAMGMGKTGFYRRVIEKYANYHNLSKDEQKIYRALRKRAVDIINHKTTSTVLEVKGLFIPKEKFRQGVIATILSHLEEDYIFEMAWFDKTRNNSYKVIENDGHITNVLIFMGVSPEYSVEGNDHAVKWEEIRRICSANRAAADVVTRGQNRSDYGKIMFYVNYIKSNAAYDFTQVSEIDGYTDAYKFINVFNGNDGTKIVCEGCSKALKYLCDMSRFDSDVKCIIASGGHHMWDIIRMDDGRNYIFDMTNGQVFKPQPENREDMDEYDLVYSVYDAKTIARHRKEDLQVSSIPYGE